MGDGLKRAALAALVSRGPRKAGREEVTGVHVERLYKMVVAGEEVPNRGSRRDDRALQLLRLAGLIEYAGTPRRWREVTRDE